MADSTAPYRADHVGSILRTAALKDARAKFDNDDIGPAELKAVEDAEIEKIIAKQAEAGLKLATDGEFRRASWSYDFLQHLAGVQRHTAEHGIQFAGVTTPAERVIVVDKVRYVEHPMIEHFTFLAEHTKATPKMTIPSPSVLHFRTGYNSFREVYPDIEEFFDDVGAAYKDALDAFYAAGCRYLQLDDTVWSYLCSEKERAGARERGDDPDRLPALYARAITKAIGERPSDMALTTHVCRGNFRSTWLAEGGYEPVAEVLLSLPYDGFFLEYDDERSGDFEPLRFLPKGKVRAVLGLVTSKRGALEDKDLLKRRIEEASRYADLDQLCLSPQCGFASTQEGNELTEDEQWAKLRHVVEVAADVWGEG